jgi:hypothetical protein
MLEYVPLMLALAVLIKVEAALYVGERDNQIHRRKLAEHFNRLASCERMAEAEPLYRAPQDAREASQAADGELRNKKSAAR